jgi:hypothetical protein
MNVNPPSYCPPDGAMVGIIQENVESLRGFKPQPIVSLGGTDARLWRHRDIPAYVHGPFPLARDSSVSMKPGAMAFTRSLVLPSAMSSAIARILPIMPALAPQWAALILPDQAVHRGYRDHRAAAGLQLRQARLPDRTRPERQGQ